jgi:hypothetical protein
MLIFIDETGPFLIPPPGARSLCAVGALVVPERAYDSLAQAYSRLKTSWTGNSNEIKGSTLSEGQVSAVIECLLSHQCLFFVCPTEMSLNSQAVIDRFQKTQVELLTAEITDAHSEERRVEAFRLRSVFERMPSTLFIQTVLLNELIKKVIDQATLHFVMRDPAEAGKFGWTIDAKDKNKTAYEAAWEGLAGGLVQGLGLESPSIAYEEGDYSSFQRFLLTEWPKHLPKPKAGTGPGVMMFNLGKILYESMTFTDSAMSEGLQLADVITNAFRRAVMGRLQRPSYDRMGELMRGLKTGPIEVQYFGEPQNADRDTFKDYNAAVSLIESKARLAGS